MANGKYLHGIMYKSVFFQRKEVCLQKMLSKLELDKSFLSTSAQYQETGKLTPGYAAILHSAPVFAESYQAKRRKELSRKAFAILEVNDDKDDIFCAYMEGWVFNDLYNIVVNR
jgi:hypothetical protein